MVRVIPGAKKDGCSYWMSIIQVPEHHHDIVSECHRCSDLQVFYHWLSFHEKIRRKDLFWCLRSIWHLSKWSSIEPHAAKSIQLSGISWYGASGISKCQEITISNKKKSNYLSLIFSWITKFPIINIITSSLTWNSTGSAPHIKWPQEAGGPAVSDSLSRYRALPLPKGHRLMEWWNTLHLHGWEELQQFSRKFSPMLFFDKSTQSIQFIDHPKHSFPLQLVHSS